MEEQRFKLLYEKLHQQNRRRIRGGLICMLIIPLVFLFMMFISNSSKIFFLVLWIVSIFIISIYLITIEYIDYLVQQMLFGAADESKGQETLIDIQATLHEKLSQDQ